MSLLTPVADAEQYQFRSFATDGGDRYWFTFEGYAGVNPTLGLRSGDEVTISITNAGNQPHNIHFGAPISRGSQYLMPGVAENFTFTVRGGLEPQTIEYWCDPHRQLGMVGTVLLGGGNGTTEAGNETPRTLSAPSLALAGVVLVALVAMRWRRSR